MSNVNKCDNLGSSLNEDKSVSVSIHYRNNAYNVDLLWYEDKIKTVSSNYSVALEKTKNNFKIENLIKEYKRCFLPTEECGNNWKN